MCPDLWITSLLFDLNYEFTGASLLALAKSMYYPCDVTPNLHRNWVIACFGSHVNFYNLFSLINEDMDYANRAAVS